MRILATGLLFFGVLATANASDGPAYPAARTEVETERRCGITYQDPFRWMENQDDPGLHEWIKAENTFTDEAVAGALRDQLEIEFERILSPETESQPLHVDLEQDDMTRFLKRVRPARAPGIETNQTISPSFRYQVRMAADSGGDLRHLTIYDSQLDASLNEVLDVKFAQVLWDADELSFVYVSDRDGRLGSQFPIVRRHKLGTRQADDEVLVEATKTDVFLSLLKVDATTYLVEGQGMGTRLSAMKDGGLSEILPMADGTVSPFHAEGQDLYFVNFRGAPMGKISVLNLDTGAVRDVAPERPYALDSALMFQGRIYATYVEDAAHALYRFEGDTNSFSRIALPGEGSAYVYLGGQADLLYVHYTDYATPPVQLKLEADGLTLKELYREAPVTQLETFKTYYRSHNGKQVPIWILKKKGLALSPETPVLQYGYGGFAVNILPGYNAEYLPWLQRGGVVATVTLPGGLEYGEDWHRAGMTDQKKNVFDDFAAASRQLIAQNFTSPAKLAINGGSNGGLLVAATMQLYPSLYRAAVPEVGVLEFTKFQLFTGGKWWITDYGDRNDCTAFRRLYSLSPYHQLRRNQSYPATLVVTGDADDRVVPTHSYKYAARLQQVQSSDRLALLHVRRGGSHGRTATVTENVRYLTNLWTFLLTELEVGEAAR